MAMKAQGERGAASSATEAKKTTMADLGDDELTCILKFVAESGARNLVVAMTVSKLFMKRAKDSTVLRALEFHDVEIWGQYLHNYQQINGLVSLAAQAGNPIAQFKFATIIMMSCTRVVKPRPDYDWSQSGTFMTQVSSQMAPDSLGVYHYAFVRHYLRQCTPNDFEAWYRHLRSYGDYYGKELKESNTLLNRMCEVAHLLRRLGEDWAALKHELGISSGDENISVQQKLRFLDEYCGDGITAARIRELVRDNIQRQATAKDTVNDLVAEFEDLRIKAVQIFDEAFLSSKAIN